MNNENLSQKLCEICGIKPDITYQVQYYVGNSARYKWVKNYFISGEIELKDMLKTYKRAKVIWVEQQFPDFEQPENFVKLLDLNVDGVSLWWTINYASILCKKNLPADRKEFLDLVCRFIKNKEYIKQAIKSQEWVYG